MVRVPPCVPALYSFLLGSIASGSLAIDFIQRENLPNLSPFAAHLASLALFHFLEYYWQAKYHPETTTTEGNILQLYLRLYFLSNSNHFKAFLLDHSKEYLMAIITGITEYSIRRLMRFSPVWIWFQLIGIILIFIGLILRSIAMVTAGPSFSHDIKENLTKGHKLVKNGIYAFCRHPSYLGFFAFTVGCQILLGNFISVSIFIFILQKFFRERIAVEEIILMRQYPREYSEYKKKTWSGIPFHSD